MKIEEAIVEHSKKLLKMRAGSCVPTDENGYWNINVVFINSDNEEDETQFDIKPTRYDYIVGKCPELVELWKEFCKENNFKQNSVEEVYFANM